jgi:hypothetical protein
MMKIKMQLEKEERKKIKQGTLQIFKYNLKLKYHILKR